MHARTDSCRGLSQCAHRLVLWVPALIISFAASPVNAQGTTPNAIGHWDPPLNGTAGGYGWPLEPIHAIHLPNAQILLWHNPGCAGGDQPDGLCDDGSIEKPRLWDPETGIFTCAGYPSGGECDPENPMDNIYDCGSAVGLESGKILWAGGGCSPHAATNHTYIFDHLAIGTELGPWSLKDALDYRRWYPSAVTIGDGRVIIFSGIGGPGPPGCSSTPGEATYGPDDTVKVPEIFDPSAASPVWRRFPSPCSEKGLWFYPHTFLISSTTHPAYNGKVCVAGPGLEAVPHVSGQDQQHTWTFDPKTGAWADVATYGPELMGLYGSAVTFAPGKILKAGGFHPAGCAASSRTGIIDFNASTVGWNTDPTMVMHNPRRDHQLVVLPTGHVLAVGGRACDVQLSNCQPFVPIGDPPCSGTVYAPVREAEWIDPNVAFPTWTRLAWAQIPRAYHSTALLLRDGRVLYCGGENALQFPPETPSSRSAEIYSPPYLFAQTGPLGGSTPVARPVILAAPTVVEYGTTFTITMDTSIEHPTGPIPGAQINLVRLGAATHGFDHNQRLVPLSFMDLRSGGMIQITAPMNPNAAPPGWYMLFYVTQPGVSSQHRVPSVATYMRLHFDDCSGDLNCDFAVNTLDLGILLSNWTLPPATACSGSACESDLDGNGVVNSLDLGILLSSWGKVCRCVTPVPTSCP